jgi:hypothetical protein
MARSFLSTVTAVALVAQRAERARQQATLRQQRLMEREGRKQQKFERDSYAAQREGEVRLMIMSKTGSLSFGSTPSPIHG